MFSDFFPQRLRMNDSVSSAPKTFYPLIYLVFLNRRKAWMKKKRFSEEQIVRIFGESETTTITAMARQHGMSEQPVYRWKPQIGRMKVTDVRELRQLR